MRSVGIVLGAIWLLSCSSSSTSKVVRDIPDGSDGGAGRDSGDLADTGNLSDRENLGDRVENDAGTPNDAGDGGDSSVAMGPVVFDPATVELRANSSAPVRLRLGPGASPGTTLEVTLTLAGTPPGDAGSSAPLSLSKSTFLLSSTVSEESFQVSAGAAAPQGAYSIRADAKVAGTSDPASTATLPVSVIGRPGELDTTFANAGYFDYQPEGNCNAEAVVPLPDGRFVVIGQALTSKMLIARFSAAGEIDNTFGPNGNGRLVVDRNFIRANALLLPDGKILVAYDENNQIHLIKILPNGTIDPNWGTAGYLTTQLSPGSNSALAVDPNGSILLGGDYYDEVARSSRAAILRLTAAGAVDTTFSTDGRVEIVFGTLMGGAEGPSGIEALTLQRNGNIVAVGGYFAPDPAFMDQGDQFFAFRVQSNGQPDTAFGTTGARRTKFGTNQFGNYESARSVVVQQSGAHAGKVVALGYYRQEASLPYLLGVVRYTTSGNLDTTFHGGGKGTHNLPNNDEDFPGVVILEPDDGMLAQIDSYAATRFIVARLNANGALDTGWGSGGMTTPVAGRAFGTAQSGRYLLVVGTAQPGQEQPQAARIARYWLR
jgi:uncharacterized delta-60 repeat protein